MGISSHCPKLPSVQIRDWSVHPFGGYDVLNVPLSWAIFHYPASTMYFLNRGGCSLFGAWSWIYLWGSFPNGQSYLQSKCGAVLSHSLGDMTALYMRGQNWSKMLIYWWNGHNRCPLYGFQGCWIHFRGQIESRTIPLSDVKIFYFLTTYLVGTKLSRCSKIQKQLLIAPGPNAPLNIFCYCIMQKYTPSVL